MPRFFADFCGGDEIVLSGENFRHISKSLRMKPGELITVCDGAKTDYECKITDISLTELRAQVLDKKASAGEADVDITIYQALPKSDKMDGIVQRAVELGVNKIVPVISHRCVCRPDEKWCRAKAERWRKIALESAMQCGRGIIPEVSDAVLLGDALKNEKSDIKIFFYEGGGIPIKELGISKGHSVAVFVGPEGGFEPDEVEKAKSEGCVIGSLGPRILRTQTASGAATAAIMFMTDNM